MRLVGPKSVNASLKVACKLYCILWNFLGAVLSGFGVGFVVDIHQAGCVHGCIGLCGR